MDFPASVRIQLVLMLRRLESSVANGDSSVERYVLESDLVTELVGAREVERMVDESWESLAA